MLKYRQLSENLIVCSVDTLRALNGFVNKPCCRTLPAKLLWILSQVAWSHDPNTRHFILKKKAFSHDQQVPWIKRETKKKAKTGHDLSAGMQEKRC